MTARVNQAVLKTKTLLREGDSNPRPVGYEPTALTNCATPRYKIKTYSNFIYFSEKIFFMIGLATVVYGDIGMPIALAPVSAKYGNDLSKSPDPK